MHDIVEILLRSALISWYNYEQTKAIKAMKADKSNQDDLTIPFNEEGFVNRVIKNWDDIMNDFIEQEMENEAFRNEPDIQEEY